MDDDIILLKLARMGAMERYVTLTTKRIGELIDSSQQSASIYIRRLEEKGLIDRTQKKAGSSIRITSEGLERMKSLYQEFRGLFDEEREIVVHGTINTGLGEGAYYLSQEGYINQLKDLFSMNPFPGTLNVKLSRKDSPLVDLLRRGPGIEINGFRSGERSFGSCLCYPCKVNGTGAVVMVPNRTLHVGTLEIISDSNLRDELSLQDGDTVELSVKYPSGRMD
jgi:riboflavin kinase